MSQFTSNPNPFNQTPLSSMDDWVEVSGRGVLSLIGFVLLGLMVWGFGFATIKVAMLTLTSIAGPTVQGLSLLGGEKMLWAVAEGAAMGVLVLLIRRGLLSFKMMKSIVAPDEVLKPQLAPSLAAGIAVGLMSLAVGLGLLPEIMQAGGEFDRVEMSKGIASALESTQLIGFGGGAGGGGGDGGAGGGPEINVIGGYGVIVALLFLLVIAGGIVGAACGGLLGGVGLGAVSGSAEGMIVGAGDADRAGLLASALSGAATGAVVGAIATAISVHVANVLTDGQRWGPLIGFDIVAAIVTALLMLLCRTSWDNPTGVLGNALEAGKFIVLLIQYALALVLVVAMLGGVLLLIKWLFD